MSDSETSSDINLNINYQNNRNNYVLNEKNFIIWFVTTVSRL